MEFITPDWTPVTTLDVAATVFDVAPLLVFVKVLEEFTRSKTWNWLVPETTGETISPPATCPIRLKRPPEILPPPSSEMRS